MFNISNEGIISISRGDSAKCPMFINAGSEIAPIRYDITANDTIYFAIMEPNQKFEDAIVKKIFTSSSPMTEEGDLIVSFVPTDTEYLLSGKYYYMVKIRTHIGDGESEDDYSVQTIIPKREFQILD